MNDGSVSGGNGSAVVTRLAYVLITPARNEAELIAMTLESVAAQTQKPLKWVIVSDGSTDGTDDVVRGYEKRFPWIELVSMPVRTERHFGGKAHAFNAGYARVKNLEYDVIGNLDADITFGDHDYFEWLLEKFLANPKLGVGGTPYREGTRTYDYRVSSIEHVSGACQMFRRACFEEIGGYRPVPSGGIDLIAVLSARAKRWKTQTFVDKACVHHRKMGAAHHTGLRERLHRGRMDYLLGSHPLWEIGRSAYQMAKRPYIVGGLLILLSFAWHVLRGEPRTMPPDLMALRRREQMQQLKTVVRRALRLSSVEQSPQTPSEIHSSR